MVVFVGGGKDSMGLPLWEQRVNTLEDVQAKSAR